MRRSHARLAAVIAFCSLGQAHAQEDHILLYYTAGWADMYVTHFGSFDLAAAEIDITTGKLLKHWNVTQLRDKAMGYLSVSPDGREAILARQPSFQDDVNLYRIPLRSDDSKSHLVPLDLLNATARESMLALCTGSNFTCTDVSTFSAAYDEDDSGNILFSFRLWQSQGYGIGNEALGMLHVDGTVQALTYKPTGLATNNTNTIDSCGRFVPGSVGSQVLFVRHYPSSLRLMLHDVAKGTTSTLAEAPTFSDFLPDACPQFVPTADGRLSRRFSYMSGPWSKDGGPAKPGDAFGNLTECMLTSAGQVADCKYIESFPIVDAGAKGSVPTAFQCRPLGPDRRSGGPKMMCLNPEGQLSVVTSGSPAEWVNITLPYTDQKHKWCMTTDCFVGIRFKASNLIV